KHDVIALKASQGIVNCRGKCSISSAEKHAQTAEVIGGHQVEHAITVQITGPDAGRIFLAHRILVARREGAIACAKVDTNAAIAFVSAGQIRHSITVPVSDSQAGAALVFVCELLALLEAAVSATEQYSYLAIAVVVCDRQIGIAVAIEVGGDHP